jgi:ABC-type multidrug transport system fused ATPase/permease subunit
MNSVSVVRCYAYSIDLLYPDLAISNGIKSDENHKYVSNYTGSLLDAVKTMSNGIKLDNIYYRYPDSSMDILSDVSLFIPASSSVAIIGTSGAGKTTLVDIILGILKPSSGYIKVDNVDIYENLANWQAQIGYIPQTIYLSDDTIRSNVAFGSDYDDIDDERVWDALEKAQLKSFVKALPEGYDTLIGENGVRLSGGQRQRIGIARALYRDPSVLVLDEATSALDSNTEAEIMRVVRTIQKESNKTVIIIAHRMSTIQNSDYCFKIEKGILTRTTVSQYDIHSDIDYP